MGGGHRGNNRSTISREKRITPEKRISVSERSPTTQIKEDSKLKNEGRSKRQGRKRYLNGKKINHLREMKKKLQRNSMREVKGCSKNLDKI